MTPIPTAATFVNEVTPYADQHPQTQAVPYFWHAVLVYRFRKDNAA